MTLSKYTIVKHDKDTGEYWFNGEWYPYYPSGEIEEYEAMRDMAIERKI